MRRPLLTSAISAVVLGIAGIGLWRSAAEKSYLHTLEADLVSHVVVPIDATSQRDYQPEAPIERRSSPSRETNANAFDAFKASCSSFQDLMNLNERSDTRSDTAIEMNRRRMSIAKEQLAASDTAEYLHAAALLESDRTKSLALLDRAITLDPNDTHLMWTATNLCVRSKPKLECPLGAWVERLTKLDGENVQAWVVRSSQLYSKGNMSEALEALEVAGRVSESTVYFADTVALSERALAAVSDYPFAERAGTAFGVGAGVGLPSFSQATAMCREASETSARWAQACERYGAQAELLGKSELEVGVAQAIQKMAREAMGDQLGAHQIQLRIEARRERSIWRDAEFTLLSMLVLMSEPTSFSSYLNDIRINGELAALQSFNTTLEQRISEQPDLVCTSLDALNSEWEERSVQSGQGH